MVAILGNCSSQTITANVTSAALPTVFDLTGSAATCPSNTGTITLNNSETGVSYQLRNSSNSNVQVAKSGTGSSLMWTAVAVGNGYYAVAISGNCNSQTGTANVSAATPPTVYTLTGSGATCSPNTGTVTLSSSETGISYQLRNSSNGNVQAAKSGTGSSLTWTGLQTDNGYHVVATAGGVCTSTTSNVAIVILSAPTVSAIGGGNSYVCVGSSTVPFTDATPVESGPLKTCRVRQQ